ncbi:MAG: putative sulfate/molybdate transporter [Armatimonadota bacterium]|nr:putative sulfate/molybdate transporter [Armatimonadota bacterium]MDR5703729.1 putative sulfate/molybdate transporter [Armatimonadota bacterium]
MMNLFSLKGTLNRRELAGAVADLGTFVPLAMALIAANGLNATSVLLIPGLLYIWGGIYYRLPIPVQPLKAFSAIAIALSLSPQVISAGSILMGISLAIVGISGLAEMLVKWFTRPLVRGLQLGIGLVLLKAALRMIRGPQVFYGSGPQAIRIGSMEIPAPLGITLAGAVLLVLLWRNRRVPASLALVLLGVVIGLLLKGIPRIPLGPAPLQFFLPAPQELAIAFVTLVVPQLPLTLANSVVACADAAVKYFGSQARRVSPKALTLDLAMSNLAAGVTLGMPVCHGAGGLTAHYVFGARSGTAVMVIGGIFVALALTLGQAATSILALLPLPILGVLLAAVGIQHALLVRDLSLPFDLVVAGAMGLVALLTGNMMTALVAGATLEFSRKVGKAYAKRVYPSPPSGRG